MKDEKDEQNGHSNFQTDTQSNPEGSAATADSLHETTVSQSSPDPGKEDDDAIEEDDSDVIEDNEDEEDYEDQDDDIDGDGDNDVIGDDDDDAHTGERGSKRDPSAALF